MAEVVGLAVGIISLSLQACGALIKYIDGIKNGTAKAQQMRAELDHLSDTLEILETVIRSSDHSYPLEVVRISVVACVEVISITRHKLDLDHDRDGATGRLIRARRLTRRLALPFKETEIQYCRNCVSSLQQYLQIARYGVQLYVRHCKVLPIFGSSATATKGILASAPLARKLDG